MTAERIWPAPAKLNLMLRIVGRRADGYHLLQTVFQFLDFGDRIRIRVDREGAIALVAALPGVPPDQDLCVRAARALRRHTGCRLGALIEVDKRLPMGGGLGGGSSDAATTLVALNRLWGLGLDEDSLAAIGLELGADVPVFVRGRAAWAEGVGERLTPIELPEPWYLVIVPDCRIATADIFADPDLTRDSPPSTIRAFLSGVEGNDCLPVVRARYPRVARALDWLGRFGDARLTGTGACVYAEFATEADARHALEALPAGWSGFVARGCNRSPLFAADLR